MALWQAKTLGVMFGGVTDEDNSEETLESIFWNDLYVFVFFSILRPLYHITRTKKRLSMERKGEMGVYDTTKTEIKS